MGRRRVTHELIANEAIRRVTFKKRKGGLLKKLSELTVLCGIPACAIIYSAYSEQPEVWPSREDATALLDRLHKLPIEKQTKHMLDQPTFLRRSISKVGKEVDKQKKKNYSLELGLIASASVPGLNINDADYSQQLVFAAHLLQQKIRAVDAKIMAAQPPAADPRI